MRTLTDKCLTKVDYISVHFNDEKVSTVRMRGPLSGANMTSNSVGLLFYSVLSTFLPAKVMMFDILILLRMENMMDLMNLMDMMDSLLLTKFLSVAFAAHYLLVCALLVFLPESPSGW